MGDDANPKTKVLFPRLYREGRYLFLLVTLLLLFFFYPFFDGFRFAPVILGTFFLAILISSVSAISPNRRSLAAAVGLAAVAFGSFILQQVNDSLVIVSVAAVAFGLFFSLIALVVLLHVLSVKEVTPDTILGTVCAYLLLGMVWTMVYSLLEILTPGSFLHGGESVFTGSENSRAPAISNLIYYSFVTLTTLGYGDITPNSPPAAALSSLEAVTGQLYIAVLIARFVGLYIASAAAESLK